MRRSTLIFSLALCAMVAITPLVVWTVAAIADGIDDVGLGTLAVSVPVGLGLAAVLLSIHGLIVNRDLADALELEYDAIASSLLAPVAEPVFAGMGATAARVASPASNRSPAETMTATMPAVEYEDEATEEEARKPRKVGKAGKAGKAVGGAVGKTGGRLVGRQVRRTQSKARFAIQKEISNTFRSMGPKM